MGMTAFDERFEALLELFDARFVRRRRTSATGLSLTAVIVEPPAPPCGLLASAQRRRRGSRPAVEDVQAEALGQLLADLDAADAVAARVEQRREDADAGLAGHDGDDAAADAALGRQADAVGPLAGVVVHAAGVHDAEHVLDVFAAAWRARR